MDVLPLILDWVLVGLIVAGYSVAGVMPLVALVAVLIERQTRASRSKERKRRYRELLKRTLGDTQEEPGDWGIFRNSPRKRVFLGARLVLDTSGLSLDGTIIDLSATGARLAFGQRVELTKGQDVDLEVFKTRERVRARVAWATATQCGVMFTGSAEALAPLMNSLADIKRDAA